MVLLKLNRKRYKQRRDIFTFHYGLIKTKSMLDLWSSIEAFTFHYGLIKTVLKL